MATMTEMLEKTGIDLRILILGTDSYTKQETGVTYHNLTGLVQGQKDIIKVGYDPQKIDISKYQPGLLVNIPVKLQTFNGKITGLQVA